MADVGTRQELATGIAEQHGHGGGEQMTSEIIGRAAGVADIPDEDEIERLEIVADRIARLRLDAICHTVEHAIHAARTGCKSVDVQSGDLSCTRKRCGDRNDPPAATDVQHVQPRDDLRMVEHVTGERLTADPRECPERRVDAVLFEIRPGRMPKRRDLAREMKLDLG